MARTSARYGTANVTSIDDAKSDFWYLYRTYETVPHHALASTEKKINAICDAANRLGIATVDALIEQAPRVLTEVTGVGGLTQILTGETADQVHSTRNLLVALAASSFIAIHADASPAYDAKPTLQQRTRTPRRAAEDDEIVLCRVHAVHLMTHPRSNGPDRQNATVYIAADAGVPPTETTAIRVEHVVESAGAYRLVVPQNRSYRTRTIELAPFHSGLLMSRTAEFADRSHLLAYAPRTNKPGTDAAALSVHNVLKNYLRTVGIKGKDITASSIYLWQLGYRLESEGIAAATKFAGMGADQGRTVLNLVHRAERKAPAQRPVPRGRGFAA
jgi:hypothetical protein